MYEKINSNNDNMKIGKNILVNSSIDNFDFNIYFS